MGGVCLVAWFWVQGVKVSALSCLVKGLEDTLGFRIRTGEVLDCRKNKFGAHSWVAFSSL